MVHSADEDMNSSPFIWSSCSGRHSTLAAAVVSIATSISRTWYSMSSTRPMAWMATSPSSCSCMKLSYQ